MQAFLWILAAVSTLAAGYLTYRADVQRAVPRPWLTALLRALVLALVWLLLLAPTISIRKSETLQPVVVFLQDESASIPAALNGDTGSYRNAVTAFTQKLKDKYKVVTWGFGSRVQQDSLFRFRQPATDMAAALAAAQEFYGQQNLGAVILAGDGRFNQGEHPLFQSLGLQAPLYTVAVGDTSSTKDLRIARVYANRTVARNSQFELRADVLALGCEGYTGSAQLLEGNTQLQTSELDIRSPRFDKALSFTVKAGTPGLHHYVIVLPPADGEPNTANNRRDVFVEVVEEKKNILLLAAAPHPDIAAIREALAGLELYNVTVRTADNIPPLNDYQVIILHGLPGAGFALPAGFSKPAWYICTGTTAPGFSTGAAKLQVNPAQLQDQYANANASFSAFGMPARANVVLEKLPPLSVPAGTVQAGPNAQVLFSQRGTNMPLWLVQAGTVPQALLVGEGLWRWRLYEYRFFHNHDVVDEYIRQTVALLAANVHENPFRTELPKYEWSDGEPVSMNAYLLNAANEQINTPEASLTLKDSSGRTTAFSFERNGSVYRLNLGLLPGGTYSYAAKTTYNGKSYASNGSFVVSGTPLELMETGADYPLLYALARKYNGQVFPAAQLDALYDTLQANNNIKPVISSQETALPLVDWKWYFLLILAVATTEWLLRKYWLAQ